MPALLGGAGAGLRDPAARRVSYLAGEPALYRSSAKGEWRFCATCGSQIEFREAGGGEVSLNSGTLDDPALVPPDRPIWTTSEVAWFSQAPRLRRFPEGG